MYTSNHSLSHKGSAITNPMEIIELAKAKKCIFHSGFQSRIPAAIVANWQLNLVVHAINYGYLHTYIPKEKKSFHESVKFIPKLESKKSIKALPEHFRESR